MSRLNTEAERETTRCAVRRAASGRPQRVAREVFRVKWQALEVNGAGIEPRQLKHLRDEVIKATAGVANGAQELTALAGGQAPLVSGECIRIALDGCQRSTQLVTHGADDLGLETISLSRAAGCLLGPCASENHRVYRIAPCREQPGPFARARATHLVVGPAEDQGNARVIGRRPDARAIVVEGEDKPLNRAVGSIVWCRLGRWRCGLSVGDNQPAAIRTQLPQGQDTCASNTRTCASDTRHRGIREDFIVLSVVVIHASVPVSDDDERSTLGAAGVRQTIEQGGRDRPQATAGRIARSNGEPRKVKRQQFVARRQRMIQL
jgi:hypothetical protein